MLLRVTFLSVLSRRQVFVLNRQVQPDSSRMSDSPLNVNVITIFGFTVKPTNTKPLLSSKPRFTADLDLVLEYDEIMVLTLSLFQLSQLSFYPGHFDFAFLLPRESGVEPI